MTEREISGLYEFEGFRLDAERRLLLSIAGRSSIALSPRVFATLLCFVEHRGELLTKDALMQRIWPDTIVEENSLNQNISMLRRALGESASEHRFIVTVPGRGYRFVPSVKVVARDASPAAHVERVGADSAASAKRSAPTSVAVLPFASLTSEPDKAYFGEGLAEELIHALAQLPELKVSARTSSFAYEGRDTDARTIARELGVEAVIEGSVRAAGKRIRVTAQLVEGKTGFHVWSQSFDRNFEDLFALQDEIAGAVVRGLKTQMQGALPDYVSHAPPTLDREAYELYLQARTLLAMPAEPRLRRAMVLLEQALTRDPNFARGLSTLAGVRLHCVLFGYPLANALEDAHREATRALEIDPTLCEARAALGQLSAFRGAFPEAEIHFRRSFSADRFDPFIAVNHSVCIMYSVGHLSRAEQEMRQARKLAPASAPVAVCLALSSILRGNSEEALREASLATALGDPPNLPPIPQIHAHVARRAGRMAEAGAYIVDSLLPAFRAAGGAEVITLVHAALADAAKVPAATAAIRDLLARAKPGDIGPAAAKDMLVWCALLGALDLAYEAANSFLDEFARSGTVGSAWDPLWLPEMRAFRQDARFQALVSRMGFIEYWKMYGPPDGCELRNGMLICP